MTTHPNDEKPYSEEEVARARELLATELDLNGLGYRAALIRQGHTPGSDYAALQAVLAALRTASQPATPASASEVVMHPSYGGVMLYSTTPASASEAVAWQEFSNGRWTEITKDRYDHLVHIKAKYPHLEVTDVRALYLHPALHQPPSGEWQPIETAPKDGTEVLICGGTYSYSWYEDEPFASVSLARWYGDHWRGEDMQSHDEWRSHKPTHWMHTPAPVSAAAPPADG